MTGDTTNKIAIYMDDKEAEIFRQFREFQDLFNMLLTYKVFNVKNGKAILNFNSDGKICDIETQVHIYKIGKS